MSDDPSRRTLPYVTVRPEARHQAGRGRPPRRVAARAGQRARIAPSTVLFDNVASMNASYPPKDGQLSYGRNGTPTQWSLAEALTALSPERRGRGLSLGLCRGGDGAVERA